MLHLLNLEKGRAGLGRLIGGSPRGHGRGHCVPDGQLLYAIGDIHGRYDLLRSLIGTIVDDVAELGVNKVPTLIFLGDYVDRGPNSKGVLDFLTGNFPKLWHCRFLKGNHEEALLRFLAEPEFGDVWREYGGLETLSSYGVPPVRNRGRVDWQATAQAFERALPQSHRTFLETLSLHETVGDYVFVHAGVRPGIPLAYQSERDLLWIREEFLDARYPSEQTVVHGHTPNEQVMTGPGRIGLDTGAYVTGRLTAAGFRRDDVWFLATD